MAAKKGGVVILAMTSISALLKLYSIPLLLVEGENKLMLLCFHYYYTTPNIRTLESANKFHPHKASRRNIKSTVQKNSNAPK